MNLLKSKFFLPGIETNHLFRANEVNKIAPNQFSGITYVIAPAGFGKSSFTSEWVRQSNAPYMWLSLEATECDFYVFAQYFLTGLEHALQRSFSNCDYFCKPNVRANHNQFLIALLNELEAVEFDFTIVLDDFYLAETPQLLAFMKAFIERLPKNCRLVILSRTPPELQINRLKLSRDFIEVSSQELRFSEQQISQYFFQDQELNIAPESINKIVNLTGGWVVLVKLIGLKYKLNSAPFQLSNDTDLYQYVLEEVLSLLPEDVRSFLYDTASLHSLNVEFCNDSLAREDSLHIINYLNKQGLFLVPLDDKDDWYRYHHLFAEILVLNRPNDTLMKLKQIHTRAALWLDKKGITQLALQEAELSGDDNLLLSLMEKTWLNPAKDLWLGSNDEYLNNQIKRLGQKFVLEYPYLYAIYGLNNIALTPEVSITLLRQIQTHMENIGNLNRAEKSALTVSYLGEAYFAAAQHNGPRLQDAGNKALTLLRSEKNKTESEHSWLGSANILMASAYWNAGNMIKAQEAMLDGVEHMEQTSNPSAIFSTYFILIHILYGSGKNKLATKYIKLAMSRLDTYFSPLPQGAAELYLAAAHAEFEHGDIDSALEYLEQSENLLVESVIHEAQHFYPLLKAKIAYHKATFEKVPKLLSEAKKLRTLTPFSDATSADYWLVRLNLFDENELFMDNWWHKQSFETASPPSYNNELDYINWAHWGLLTTKFNEKKLELLLLTLEGMAAEAIEKHRFRTVIESKVLTGTIKINLSIESYKQEVSEAVKIAEDNQISFYLNQFPVVKKWRNNKKLSRNLPDVLLSSLSTTQQSKLVDITEKLSKTELKILGLLQTELSGPEICNCSFISLNTFRTHTKNIYSKLNVNSRLAAVNKGKKLRLI